MNEDVTPPIKICIFAKTGKPNVAVKWGIMDIKQK